MNKLEKTLQYIEKEAKKHGLNRYSKTVYTAEISDFAKALGYDDVAEKYLGATVVLPLKTEGGIGFGACDNFAYHVQRSSGMALLIDVANEAEETGWKMYRPSDVYIMGEFTFD